MIDFVIFVILTCYQPPSVVVLDMESHNYYEGGRIQDIPAIVPEGSEVLIIETENNTGICT